MHFASGVAQLASLAESHSVGVVYNADSCLQEFFAHVVHELGDDMVFFFVVLGFFEEFTTDTIALNVCGLEVFAELASEIRFAGTRETV